MTLFYAPRRRWLFFFAVLPVLSASALRLGAAPLPVAPKLPFVAEFGEIRLDISDDKAFSRLISERKTIANIRSNAKGVARFRRGAGGYYRIALSAPGKVSDDQGTCQCDVSIEILRLGQPLRVFATSEGSWHVPAQVPESWAPSENPYEPIFGGPDAKRDKREWRRQKAERGRQKNQNQKQARDAYRIQAIRSAFGDSLHDAREAAEKQLRTALNEPAKVPTAPNVTR